MSRPSDTRGAGEQLSPFPRVDVLGVGISAINLGDTLDTMEKWIASDDRQYICVANVHSVMEARQNPALRDVLNASGLTTPDGMPLVWLSKWAGHKDVSRVYGPDVMLDFCARSCAKGYRHFFYGGMEGVPEELAGALALRMPGLEVAGTYSPPFRPLTPGEDRDVVRRINDVSPDVVWVGMGAPKQERWMAAHRPLLDAPILIGVGAAFDFHTGRVKQSPAWLQHAGLEWAYRLAQEPRRLWYRYLVYNPHFMVLVARQALTSKCAQGRRHD